MPKIQDDPFWKFVPPDCEGNSALHQLIQYFSYEKIMFYIYKQPEPELIQLACQTNWSGKLPIHLLENRKHFTLTQTTRIEHALVALMRQQTVKPLTEPVTLESLISELGYEPNKELHQQLQAACDVINWTREHIYLSSSHPDSNKLSASNFFRLSDKIIEQRKERNRLILLKHKDCHGKEVTDLLMQSPLGNCDEMALLAYEGYQQFYPQSKVEVSDITNGDHVFLIVDDNLICDPWYGTAFPLQDLSKRLSDHVYFNDGYYDHNFIVPFNPDFHEISHAPETCQIQFH